MTRAYAGLARTAARAVLAHRLNFVLGLFAVLFQLLAMLSVWAVLLRSGSSIGGFTWPEMKSYLLIAYATGAIQSMADYRLAFRIRDGMVAVDLTKPVDFQRARFAEAVGVGAVEIGFSALVCAGVLALIGGAPAPSPGAAALFVVSFLLVVPLKFCLTYLTGMLAFWTENFFGVGLTKMAVTNLFSGALVPLTMLPGWLQAMAAVLPFASITFTPAMIYLGHAAGAEAALLIGVQVIWVAVLWFGGRLAWRGAVRQLTVHGG
ncbi:MAG TPA: ABC-2 family transporter protein [Micromonosporaceae bacterium]|nr:ABC-2 family transporter protein [Micromonosporaceae bacterium]